MLISLIILCLVQRIAIRGGSYQHEFSGKDHSNLKKHSGFPCRPA